ncbi:MAG: NAD-dependent epimerase/dehydratase family protein [Flavobacteriales bacterium]|tara:strand:- start:664 stop:1596 length:933 start_codon:yes stop_codon:yes gene_type:complete
MEGRVLVIGSSGQIGTELVEELRKLHGNDNVIASDIREPQVAQEGPFEILDILNKIQLSDIVEQYDIKEVYLLAAMLSATAEKNPAFGWELNMNSLFNVLNLAKDGIIDKIFWPSSIAVFGPTTPQENTPQYTIMEPSTVYGISKQAGERWCEYYHKQFGVDVRSIRYPGLIGYKSKPGGGTTDYAVDIFHKALEQKSFDCFLSANTTLPMMYMSDAIKATINIMKADSSDIKIRSSYNVSGMSFSPTQIADEIRKSIPEFKISYTPDYRQEIADSWPKSINDASAKEDWNWTPDFDLATLTNIMLENIS